MVVIYILIFLLILGIVVCFHEYGHYHFAKKANILVNEFAFGMGPKLVSKKKGETYWSIRALPIGGFCAMSGEEMTDSPVKVNDEVKLVFDEDGKVSKIVLNSENPDYADVDSIKVDKIDLFGKDMSPLFINDYEVRRDCLIILSKKEEIQIAPEERNFFSKTVWQRFLVCFGGPLNNIILALIVFIVLGLASGVGDTGSSIVGEVSINSPAEIAGIQKNDKILKIGNYSITNWEDIGDAIYETKQNELEISYERNGDQHITLVTPQYIFQNLGFVSNTSNKEKMEIVVESDAALGGTNKTKAYQDGQLRNGDLVVGVIYGDKYYDYENMRAISSWDDLLDFATNEADGGKIQIVYNRPGVFEEGSNELKNIISNSYDIYSTNLLRSQGYESAYKQIGVSCRITFKFFPCLANGFRYLWESATIIFSTLWLLLTSKEVGLKDMGGFVTILNQTATYASGGFTSLLYWLGLLSINLGIVNLLPIPALDGGRIIFLLVEGITGKKINQKVETIIINIFFWLLMALIIYILGQDIWRLVIQLK